MTDGSKRWQLVVAGVALLVVIALVAVTCGGDDDGGATDGTAPGGTDASQATESTENTDSTEPEEADIPLASVEVGDGTADVVALWRQGDFVRLALSGELSEGGNGFSTRFGRGRHGVSGMLLVDPATRTVHRVLREPPTDPLDRPPCLCSDENPLVREGLLFYADFKVAESVDEVLVLGDAVPPFGVLPIAQEGPDVEAAGYEWAHQEPPPLGSLPFDPAAVSSPIIELREAPDAVLQVEAPEVQAVSLPSDVLFDVDSATLGPDAAAVVDQAAAALGALPAGTEVVVVGHTDDQGSDAHNLDLSVRRAEAVAAALAGPVSAAGLVISTAGRGESEPIVANADAEGRAIPSNQALNRRVEIQAPDIVAVPTAPPAGFALPPDAAAAVAGSGDVAATEFAPPEGIGAVYRVVVEAVEEDELLGLLRIDLRQELVSPAPGQTFGQPEDSLKGDERLGHGASALRLVELDTGVEALPSASQAGDCLCPDYQTHTIVVGTPNRFTVWFPMPAGDTANLLIPRAGLLRDLPIG